MGDNYPREVDDGDIHPEPVTYLKLMQVAFSNEIRTRLGRNEVISVFRVIDKMMDNAEIKANKKDEAEEDRRRTRNIPRRLQAEEDIEKMKKVVDRAVTRFFRTSVKRDLEAKMSNERKTESIMFENFVWRRFQNHWDEVLTGDEGPLFAELREFMRRAADGQEELERNAKMRRESPPSDRNEAMELEQMSSKKRRVNAAAQKVFALLRIRRDDSPRGARRERLPPIPQAQRNRLPPLLQAPTDRIPAILQAQRDRLPPTPQAQRVRLPPIRPTQSN